MEYRGSTGTDGIRSSWTSWKNTQFLVYSQPNGFSLCKESFFFKNPRANDRSCSKILEGWKVCIHHMHPLPKHPFSNGGASIHLFSDFFMFLGCVELGLLLGPQWLWSATDLKRFVHWKGYPTFPESASSVGKVNALLVNETCSSCFWDPFLFSRVGSSE